MSTAPAPAIATMRKLTPVIAVDAIEPCLPFWTERLGFSVTVQVPEGEHLGFVILQKDAVELMYQSRASAAADIPALAAGGAPGTGLFVEVSDVDAVERALHDAEVVLPRRRTFYGTDEVCVREPGGSVVVFAQRGEG